MLLDKILRNFNWLFKIPELVKTTGLLHRDEHAKRLAIYFIPLAKITVFEFAAVAVTFLLFSLF